MNFQYYLPQIQLRMKKFIEQSFYYSPDNNKIKEENF